MFLTSDRAGFLRIHFGCRTLAQDLYHFFDEHFRLLHGLLVIVTLGLLALHSFILHVCVIYIRAV